MNQPRPSTPPAVHKEKSKKQKSKSKDKDKDKEKDGDKEKDREKDKGKEKDKSKKSKKKKKKSREHKDLDGDPWAFSKHKSLPEPPRQPYAPERPEEEEAVAIESSDDETTLSTGYRVTSHEQQQSSPFQHSYHHDPPSSEWQAQPQQHPQPISPMQPPAAKAPTFASQTGYENPSQVGSYTASSAPRVVLAPASMDDEDEDVCPVCEFECTCGPPAAVNVPKPVLAAPSPAIAAKAPMPSPQLHPPYQPEQESVSVGLSFQESPAESFQSAFKSPMVTPSGISHRRPSLSRQGGKGVGKAPVVLSAVKNRAYKSSQGKTLESNKAMQYYRHLLSSSGSEDDASDLGSEDEMESNTGAHVAYKRSHVVLQDTHTDDHDVPEPMEDDDEEESGDEADDALSIGSSSSLSDPEDGVNDYESAGESPSKHRSFAVNSTKGSKWIAKDVDQVLSPTLKPSTVNATSPPILVSKRGSSRPKKRKDSLGLTREDEDHLYMPAVASSWQRGANILSKAHGRSPSKKAHRARRESLDGLPTSTPPLSKEYNEASAHYEGSKSESEDGLQSSDEGDDDDDIFGDGELSDAPSDDYFDDDLSEDIEAFDDFDGDETNQLLYTSDDLESTSSGPHEYHYSDLEEEDEESLVDSDSSLNTSSQSDSDNGSETSTDSEIEPPQPAGSPDEDMVAYDSELDEDELLRLAEEERRIVQRAHLLQEYLSEEEEADPDRNPFESSEEEDSSTDEYEFDADGEGYEDDYYEDEEDDYFDQGLNQLSLVYDEYKGSKLEMQALMMIPPEQQEQLLLLQHYAEQQQQKLQQQQEQERGQSHSLSVPDVAHASLPPIAGAQDAAFFMTVPDLDAVSEQLAQSLATSMASSLAGSMSEASPPEDTSTATTPLPSSASPTPTLSTLGQTTLSTTTALGESAPLSIITSALPAPSPGATTPTSVTSASTIMPTPANTPTPPAESEAPPKEEEALSEALTMTGEENSSNAQSTSPVSSPQYETISADLAATTPTSTLSSQEFLESLDAATAQLLVKTLEQSSQDLHVGGKAADESPLDVSGSLLSTFGLYKRKGELLGGKDIENGSKRRRTSLSATVVGPGLLQDMTALMDIGTGSTSDHAGPSKASTPGEPRTALANLLTSTSPAELTPGLISLVSTAKLDPAHLHGRRGSMRSLKGRRSSKSEPQDGTTATVELMPMDDLLDTSALYGEHTDDEEPAGIPQTISKDLSRWEKVPIGTFRRSRRPSSPYIGLQGAIKSGRQDIESALLSAAHPNRSEASLHHDSRSHPAATSSGGSTRDVLRRIQRGGVGMRRYRSNPASLSGPDLQAIMHQQQQQQQPQQGVQACESTGKSQPRPIHHLRSASQLPLIATGGSGSPLLPETLMAMMGNTPPSVHVGMLMDELTSLGSPKDLSTTAAPLLGAGNSISGTTKLPSLSSSLSLLPANLTAAGHARSAHIEDLFSQDSRYHSLSTGASSSRRRRMTRSLSQHAVGGFRTASQSGPHSLSSRQRGGGQRSSKDGLVAGLGIDVVDADRRSSTVNHHERRRRGSEGTTVAVAATGEEPLRSEDVMTDVSQLPSSACPTPLHSPLFSATDAVVSSSVVEDVPKDAAIPPLSLDPSDFAKISSLLSSASSSSSSRMVIPSSSSSTGTVQLNLRQSAEDDDEEIDIDDDTDVDAIWRATFGHAEESTDKAPGAGIGGLLLGIMLDRAGISYHILEKNTEDKNVLGACIMLTPKVLKLFDQLDLLEGLVSISKEYKESFVVDERLESLGKLDLKFAHDRYHYPILVVGRPALMAFLLSKIHPDKVSFAKRILRFEYSTDSKPHAAASAASASASHDSEPGFGGVSAAAAAAMTSEKGTSSSAHEEKEADQRERVMVHCADRSVYTADLLVGADGAYSAVRQNLYRRIQEDKKAVEPLPESDLEPMFFDRHACLGITEPLSLDKYPLLKSPTCEFRIVAGQVHPFVLWTMPMPENRLAWTIGGKLLSPRTVDHDDVSFSCSEYTPEATRELLDDPTIREIRSPFGGTVGVDLIDQTQPDRVSRILIEEKLFKTWSDYRRCVLMGDAAHKPSPTGGHGAMSAAADAVALCNGLHALLVAKGSSRLPTREELGTMLRGYYDERFTSARNGIVGDLKRKVLLNYVPQWLHYRVADKMMYPQPVLDFLPIPDRQLLGVVSEKTV
ncbi:hypothetical protein DFQ27_005840 [Actinomortierella ambigua]|uniref:FAD-binding domain-containing protein n=1 Tax=Actinomortierella ambigua TaxID=1343610 RepID=A0A9P6QJI8_9FUNG|nr:hypothetical protein DFQ27_005840 [Actinomortierella ambigua]